ncbi:MAG TPA: metal-dependent transcriptional regulator [Atribacteraceae bacterium]|nr:metal-dependent transcriptional regulator [Atribacteraceae bacterium]
MATQGRISPSLQDYLETILELAGEKGAVRITDIADHLGFTKPSVHQAARDLVKIGYLKQAKYGPVELTRRGREQARQVLEKHRVVYRFLVELLGVDPETAEKDACRIEHVVSPLTFLKLSEFLDKTDVNKTEEKSP